MTAANPRQSLAASRDIVVKLGTQLLADQSGALDAPFVRAIADQVALLKNRGVRVTVVSSGAIGPGMRELNPIKRPTEPAKLHATARAAPRRLFGGGADDLWPPKPPAGQR